MKKIIIAITAFFLLTGTISFAQNELNADFGPYMRSMQRKIKSNWNPPKGMESKRVVLLYSLNKKGEVIKVSVYNTSGNVDMDNAAIEALKNSAPFGSLPPEFKGDHIDVQFSFDYNVWTKEGKI